MTLIDSIKTFKENELLSHVELDDVIIKVSQELLEMLEAKINNDTEELRKETMDTIVNVLSASAEVGVVPNPDTLSRTLEVSDPLLLMGLKKWNQGIQALRKRYSRDVISPEELTTTTEEFLSQLLSYGQVDNSLEEILEINGMKFAQRINAYKPDLDIKDYIREYQDFPKAPVVFKDITPLLQSPEAMRFLCFELAEKAQ